MNSSTPPLSDRISDLIKQQLSAGVVADYFSSSKQGSAITYLTVGFDQEYICQVNPMRDPSQRAVLKKGSKGCFLCEENMPDEERGIPLDKNWKLYPNPRPYERNHVVMVLMKSGGHHPFQIIDKKEHLSKAIDTIWQLGHLEKRNQFNLTFNSIKAGASSRHFHYQLFECRLPIENFTIQFETKNGLGIGEIPSYPAKVLVIEGQDKNAVASKLWEVIDKLNSYSNSFIPYVLLFKIIDGNVRVYIFPRSAEIPAKVDPDLIDTKFGICEMSGMTIVYSDAMANKIDSNRFEKSLRAVSNSYILDEIIPII